MPAFNTIINLIYKRLTAQFNTYTLVILKIDYKYMYYVIMFTVYNCYNFTTFK